MKHLARLPLIVLAVIVYTGMVVFLTGPVAQVDTEPMKAPRSLPTLDRYAISQASFRIEVPQMTSTGEVYGENEVMEFRVDQIPPAHQDRAAAFVRAALKWHKHTD